MHQSINFSLFVPIAVFLTCACEASQQEVGGAKTSQQSASTTTDNQADRGKNLNEQTPINQQFRSLDDYLAHLERTQGPVDGPWYKEVRPGIYELQTGNLHLDGPGAEKRTFTREELEREFGFAK
jgi:hypothetical protein